MYLPSVDKKRIVTKCLRIQTNLYNGVDEAFGRQLFKDRLISANPPVVYDEELFSKKYDQQDILFPDYTRVAPFCLTIFVVCAP